MGHAHIPVAASATNLNAPVSGDHSAAQFMVLMMLVFLRLLPIQR